MTKIRTFSVGLAARFLNQQGALEAENNCGGCEEQETPLAHKWGALGEVGAGASPPEHPWIMWGRRQTYCMGLGAVGPVPHVLKSIGKSWDKYWKHVGHSLLWSIYGK